MLHPALESYPGHAIWKRDFKGSSGLFSIILKPCSDQALAAMLDGLALFGMGYSWGGFESLVIPFDCATYRTATRWEPGGHALRFHIGLEELDDLKRDLDAGFARLRETDARGSLRSDASAVLIPPKLRPPWPETTAPSASLLLGDQHQVADIDEDREGLAEDDHDVAAGKAVDQGHQAARDGQNPEPDRDDALFRLFARDPLHEEAGAEHELGEHAEGRPEVEPGNHQIVEIKSQIVGKAHQHQTIS